ncbi:MAG TPA: MEKHLA domain-containing protein, partial [Nitrosomonas sp.]|nr:MEKHLA domain-containing protein [Nitrosomonas sp.]
MTNESDWTNPLTLTWRQYLLDLLDSYAHWTGKELISRSDSSFVQVQRLFDSPFVVVSYALQDDPVLNYGNRTALDLWEMDWDRFTQTPSRLTAEPVNREERARMLSQARKQGYL